MTHNSIGYYATTLSESGLRACFVDDLQYMLKNYQRAFLDARSLRKYSGLEARVFRVEYDEFGRLVNLQLEDTI